MEIEKNSKSRNYGIDLLRIVSMLSIVMLHILGHGGVLGAAEGQHLVAGLILKILAFPAVCCFMLISGFVGYRQESYYPKMKNIISLFLTVLFYSVVLTVGVKICAPDSVGILELLMSFFPVLTRRYWFFTSYFVVFIFSPALNCAVHKLSAKMLTVSFLSIVLIGTLDQGTQMFNLSSGYSFVWLSFLYLIGASSRKYDLLKKIPLWFCFFSIIASFLITFLVKMMFSSLSIEFSGITVDVGNLFIAYCSPTILVMALGWLCLFERMHLPKAVTKAVTFCSASAFSVYLIHDNETIRRVLMNKRFVFLLETNTALTLAGVICCGLAIFFCCILIDKIRLLLFRYGKVDLLAGKLESIIATAFDRMFKSIRRLLRHE